MQKKVLLCKKKVLLCNEKSYCAKKSPTVQKSPILWRKVLLYEKVLLCKKRNKEKSFSQWKNTKNYFSGILIFLNGKNFFLKYSFELIMDSDSDMCK